MPARPCLPRGPFQALHSHRLCRFYFHASEARDWLRMQHLRAMIASPHDQGVLSDRVAAEVLAHMSAGESRDNGGGRASPTTSGHTTSRASPHPSAHRPPHVHRVQPRPVSAAPTLPMLPALQTGPAMNGGLETNGFLPGAAQSPHHPHHRAAMRSSAINYSRPLGLPSLESMGAGEEGDGAGAQVPATTTLPVLQHPLPAERRRRQREQLLSQSNAGTAPAAAAAEGKQAAGAGDEQLPATGGDGGGEGERGAAAEGIQGQGEPAAAAAAAAGEPGMLRWGCTELIAQRESLLPAPLAEHLAHICALHDAKMAALEEAERMASQVEGAMHHEAQDLQGAQ
ncbi:hypothetical protein DUNSADRAFT_15351 [Dunaliella salina]|uniref:Encoded protein n=1 Tax=Dunaliella salina TaxID=3046 RepID=A0ABQ7G5J4_DUNSA|nr:hypothetical protein DUNSADRAFT_15351 [Dunaliella salina]|eukprot:KAF5829888.1 hypothetical protein DUNSADRAFT_15351 [Dunaliella salina]